jgi:hypothetical protein
MVEAQEAAFLVYHISTLEAQWAQLTALFAIPAAIIVLTEIQLHVLIVLLDILSAPQIVQFALMILAVPHIAIIVLAQK